MSSSSSAQIVVCLRMGPAGMRPGAPNSYVARARQLARRAAPRGSLVAFSAMTLAISFSSLEDAVELAVAAAAEVAPEAERWAVGIVEGALEAVDATVGGLAWGEPLLVGLTLARLARAGEVLVHVGVTRIEALRLGELRATQDGGVEVRGHRLDLARPLRRGPGEDASPVPPAASPSGPAAPAPPRRSVLSSLETASTAPIAPAPVAGKGPPPLPPEQRSATPGTASPLPPLAAPVRPTPAPPKVAPPEAPAAPPPPSSRGALAASKAAFLARDPQTLTRSAETLAADASRPAGRIRAFADFTRGDVGPALRALERARADATGPARCQATLALAVMLAGLGKVDDALLEGLDALARARELGDGLAADACARFLTRLTESRIAALNAPPGDELLDVDVDLEDFDDAAP